MRVTPPPPPLRYPPGMHVAQPPPPRYPPGLGLGMPPPVTGLQPRPPSRAPAAQPAVRTLQDMIEATLMPPPPPRSPRPLAEPPPPVSSWLPGLLDASHHGPMPPPRQSAGLPLTDAIETFTSRVLRSGNDAEALGTHSTSVADVRKKYKEAAAMLHSDKQHGRDEAARRWRGSACPRRTVG